MVDDPNCMEEEWWRDYGGEDVMGSSFECGTPTNNTNGDGSQEGEYREIGL